MFEHGYVYLDKLNLISFTTVIPEIHNCFPCVTAAKTRTTHAIVSLVSPCTRYVMINVHGILTIVRSAIVEGPRNRSVIDGAGDIITHISDNRDARVHCSAIQILASGPEGKMYSETLA